MLFFLRSLEIGTCHWISFATRKTHLSRNSGDNKFLQTPPVVKMIAVFCSDHLSRSVVIFLTIRCVQFRKTDWLSTIPVSLFWSHLFGRTEMCHGGATTRNYHYLRKAATMINLKFLLSAHEWKFKAKEKHWRNNQIWSDEYDFDIIIVKHKKSAISSWNPFRLDWELVEVMRTIEKVQTGVATYNYSN